MPRYNLFTPMALLFWAAFSLAAIGQDIDRDRLTTPLDGKREQSVAAYNVRMAIHQNNTIIGTPQVTMKVGTVEMSAINKNTKTPYKIIFSILDENQIHKQFPNISLQSSFEDSVFVNADLFMPDFLGQPVNQWKKIASPAAKIKANGQQVRIRSDASKLGLYTPTDDGSKGKFLTEVGLDISVLPTLLTQQQIDRAKK